MIAFFKNIINDKERKIVHSTRLERRLSRRTGASVKEKM